MTDEYTKWHIKACFQTESGDEIVETKSFWSKIAETEEEAINRYQHPDPEIEMLEVYYVTRDETESIESEPPKEKTTTEEDLSKDIIHA